MWHCCRKTAGVGLFFSSLHVSETRAARHCSHLQTVGSEWKQGSLPKDFQQSQEADIEADPWLAHKLSVCLQATCSHFWVPLQCPCTSAGCQGSVSSGRTQTQAGLCHGGLDSSPEALSDAKSLLTLPNCLVTFGNSRVGSRPFPLRQVSSLPLQTCVKGLCVSLTNRPFSIPTTKALSALQNKHNWPTYNRAAFLHWFVPPRKGPGAEEVWNFAFHQPEGNTLLSVLMHTQLPHWPSHLAMLHFSYCFSTRLEHHLSEHHLQVVSRTEAYSRRQLFFPILQE